MRGQRLKIAVLIAVFAVGAVACSKSDTPNAGDNDEVSLKIVDAPKEQRGNVATLNVDVTGIEIVKADGDTSGDSGHFHVFIDREPVDVGDVIPKGRDVVHSADNPIKIWGLEPGEHEFTVVLGDGTHKRIEADAEDSATIDMLGPSVQGSAPATIEEGDDLTVELKAFDVDIVKPEGAITHKTGHFHVFVDPATPPQEDDIIPAAVENKIFHTTESEVTVTDLAKGEHIIWVVLGDGTHRAFEPAVMDKLTVTVS